MSIQVLNWESHQHSRIPCPSVQASEWQTKPLGDHRGSIKIQVQQ